MSRTLCDSIMLLRLKNQICRKGVRPAIIFGLKTVPMKKINKKKDKGAKIDEDVTRRKRTRNEVIKEMGKISRISRKVQK